MELVQVKGQLINQFSEDLTNAYTMLLVKRMVFSNLQIRSDDDGKDYSSSGTCLWLYS